MRWFLVRAWEFLFGRIQPETRPDARTCPFRPYFAQQHLLRSADSHLPQLLSSSLATASKFFCSSRPTLYSSRTALIPIHTARSIINYSQSPPTSNASKLCILSSSLHALCLTNKPYFITIYNCCSTWLPPL